MMLDELRRLADAKTPGQWQYDSGNWEIEVTETRLPIMRVISAYDRATCFGPNTPLEVPCDPVNDAEFIVACANNIDKLLAVVEAAIQFRKFTQGKTHTGEADGIRELDKALAKLEES